MIIIIRRAVMPLFLIIAGIAALVYGMTFHKVPVLEEHESEETIMVPEAFSARPPSFPGMDPMNGPPILVKKTVKKKSLDPIDLLEPALTRDATIGGIVLNETKHLQRTYTGKPPSLCPT
jgi:hypothetical protein